MTMNSSGPISLAGTTTGQSIEIELGGSGTSQISLNCTNVRSLAGVSSGAIIMPTNFYGKSGASYWATAVYGYGNNSTGVFSVGSNTMALFIYNSTCLLYTSPSPRDGLLSRMPSSA